MPLVTCSSWSGTDWKTAGQGPAVARFLFLSFCSLLLRVKSLQPSSSLCRDTWVQAAHQLWSCTFLRAFHQAREEPQNSQEHDLGCMDQESRGRYQSIEFVDFFFKQHTTSSLSEAVHFKVSHTVQHG